MVFLGNGLMKLPNINNVPNLLFSLTYFVFVCLCIKLEISGTGHRCTTASFTDMESLAWRVVTDSAVDTTHVSRKGKALELFAGIVKIHPSCYSCAIGHILEKVAKGWTIQFIKQVLFAPQLIIEQTYNIGMIVATTLNYHCLSCNWL